MKAPPSRKKTILVIAFIAVISLSIKFATFYPGWIEKNYSRNFYPQLSQFFRLLFGRLPFSLGDLLYLVAGCYILIHFIKLVKILFRRHWNQFNLKAAGLKLFFIVSGIYIWFNIAWGLNYNRPGIASQLQLNPTMYDTKDLKLITSLLINRVNENRIALGYTVNYQSDKQVFLQAQNACGLASSELEFLAYQTPSVKRSMYGKLGNFLGFIGYYNPFTGEAQLNLTQPRFLLPYVTCHEMSHQLGYASESEASFAAYLICMKSDSRLFHYSAYFDLFSYANRELALRDSAAAKNNYRMLDTLVKKDFAELRDYWRKSDNVIEPFINIFYDRYLKANHQSKGIKSYHEVTGWLIAYYKKYGKM